MSYFNATAAGEEILKVVRGDQDWRNLEAIGVTIVLRDDKVAVLGSIPSPVVVGARDVAAGWLRHAGNTDGLRRWAKVLMGAVSIFELGFREDGDEDALKEALWTVSFGGQPTAAMENLARRVLLRPIREPESER